MADRTKPSTAEIRELAEQITPVDEVDPYAKVGAYGRNGSGKTKFAASAPNCLIVDINERGTRSAAGLQSGAKKLEIGTWHQVGNAYWYLKSGKHKFKTVALDTVTAMHDVAMAFVLGEAEDRDPTRERAMPDKRSYNRSGQLTKGMLLAYRNLPMHVIFLAQERTIRDEDTGEVVERTVDLPAGTRAVATGCVGIFGRMVPKEVRVKKKSGGRTSRWVDHMMLAPHEVIYTKDRTRGALGNVLRNPTMPKIIEAWGDIEEEE